MRLSEYFLDFGQDAFLALAKKARASVSYLTRLAYTRDLPSMPLAKRLVRASDGKLTLEGLSDPIPIAEMRRINKAAKIHANTQSVTDGAARMSA